VTGIGLDGRGPNAPIPDVPIPDVPIPDVPIPDVPGVNVGGLPAGRSSPAGPGVRVFADHGTRGTRWYGPDGRLRVESTQWRGMCLQSPRRDGSDHTFADGLDLLSGPLRLAETATLVARQVVAGPVPGPDLAGVAQLDGWLSSLAQRCRVELTWAGYRQRVAVGTVDSLVRDERWLSTVEVADPAAPGCSELVQWDDADVAAGKARLERAAADVRELSALQPATLPNTPIDVVLDPGRAGAFFHELVGHPLEADIVAARSSYLAGRSGELVAPPWLTVADGSGPAGEGLVVAVDDEGIRVRTVLLIDAGRVAGVLCDRLSGEALSLASNGHGRRLDYRHPLIPRMWHTRATCGRVAAEEPRGAVRLRPRGLRLRWMNLLTGEAEFAADEGVLDTGDGRPRRTGRCTFGLHGGTVLAALRPGSPSVRGGGRATKGCGKLGQFPVVTTFANSGLWIPGEAVDVRSDPS
jgi:TldD protein